MSVSYHQSWANEFYLLNTKKHPTDNLWVRRAIASSLNRKTLANYIYKNTAVEPKGLIPQSIPLFIEPDSLISFDLDLAKGYLKNAEIDLSNTTIDLSYVSTYEEYLLTTFMLLDNLRKLDDRTFERIANMQSGGITTQEGTVNLHPQEAIIPLSKSFVNTADPKPNWE